MSTFKLIVAIAIVLLGVFLWYHFFVDTLRFSDLTGSTNNPMEVFFVNLLDFDTNLTRWDIHRLKTKAIEWKAREIRINSIADPYTRKVERDKLMAEMMQDPSFKKIAQKVYGMGGKGLKATIDAVANFSLIF